MRFTIAVLSLFAQLSMHARFSDIDSITDDQDSTFKNGLSEIANITDEWKNHQFPEALKAYCNFGPVRWSVERRCTWMGKEVHQQMLCKGCMPITGNDMHEHCRVPCCDSKMDGKLWHDRCRCTPYKAPYDYSADFPHGAVGADSPNKCCGRNAGGGGNFLPGKLCGCTDVGVAHGYGGYQSDCCSGLKREEDDVCIPGPCAKKGESGSCCRIASDTDDREHKDSCPCFHAGDALNPNDDVTFDNCCSGKVNDAGNACACLNDPNKRMPPGAIASDCCSGQVAGDGQHCVASTCSAVGATVENGQHCCSDKKDGQNKCQCIPSGESIPDDATALDCCSNSIDSNRLCSYMMKSALVPSNVKPQDVCFNRREPSKSGESWKCGCIQGNVPPLGGRYDTQWDPTQCCDSYKAGLCRSACSAVGATLEQGQHCCSDKKDGQNKCQCIPSGESIPADATALDCCSESLDSNRLCSYLMKGALVPSNIEPEDVCFSRGDTVKDGEWRKCGCIQGKVAPVGGRNDTLWDPTQCCHEYKAGLCTSSLPVAE